MEDKRLIQLALDALETRRQAIESERGAIESEMAALKGRLGEEYAPRVLAVGSATADGIVLPRYREPKPRVIPENSRTNIKIAARRRWYLQYLANPDQRPKGWERDREYEKQIKDEGFADRLEVALATLKKNTGK